MTINIEPVTLSCHQSELPPGWWRRVGTNQYRAVTLRELVEYEYSLVRDYPTGTPGALFEIVSAPRDIF